MTNFMKTAGMAVVMAAATAMLPQAASAQVLTLVVDVDQIYKDSVAAKSGGSQLEAKYGARLKTVQATLETAVKGWNIGDRVTFDSTVSCGKCYFCQRGEINLCENRQVL
ncbi:MAG: alcohol dehydrogenase catalytic domain-containing protein, partial [Sphingomonas sp.]|nr:alcohol dehydrogenase catalytic domain-containing protein [Sphingomonas sp.]